MATLTDKILFFPTVGLILANTTLAAVTGPFRGKEGAPTYFEHVINTLVRSVLSYCRIEQLQWILPSFVETYKSWCKSNNVPTDIVDIPNTTTQGFWLGPKSTAKYTMVYFHGGGYMAPGSSQHIDLAMRMIRWSDNNLAVFMVAYTLAPGGYYPTQISECVEGLRYVLDHPSNPPETTLVGGDSAGGALAFAVLSHLSHPHPQSQAVRALPIKGQLKGAVTVAPWSSSDHTKYPSMNKYANRDTVNTANAQYWSEAYKGRGKTTMDDPYIYACLAEPSWWKDVRCENVLVTAGAEEGLSDAVSDLVKKYEEGAGKDKIEYVIGERETHVAPLLGMGEKKLEEVRKSKQEGGIRLWIKDRLIV